MHRHSICDAIVAGQPHKLEQYTSVLKYLPVKEIGQYLVLNENDYYRCPFEITEGYSDAIFSKTAVAYANIYSELIDVLPQEVFSELFISGFLKQCPYIIGEAINKDLPEILDRFAELWDLVRNIDKVYSGRLLNDSDQSISLGLARDFYDLMLWDDFRNLLQSGSLETMHSARKLFQAIRIVETEGFFDCFLYPVEGDRSQHLPSCFELFKQGKGEIIDEYIQLLKLCPRNEEISKDLDGIETARKKYECYKAALEQTNLSDFSQRRLLAAKSLPIVPGSLQLL